MNASKFSAGSGSLTELRGAAAARTKKVVAAERRERALGVDDQLDEQALDSTAADDEPPAQGGQAS